MSGVRRNGILIKILRIYRRTSKKKTFNLETINNEITQLYAKGKINESQHKMLNEKASEYYTNTSK
jgi:hypothetical protein